MMKTSAYNQDVYCVRALAWTTAKEENKAIKDLNYALKLNSSHACALILRGTIIKSLLDDKTEPVRTTNTDHKKVLELHPEAKIFLDIKDFNSPKMEEFYNRFLWRLNIPHTIVKVDLLAEIAFAARAMGPPKRTTSASECKTLKAKTHSQGQQREPFHCGTVASFPDSISIQRRSAYGMAVRQYSAQIKGSGMSNKILKLTKSTQVRHEQKGSQRFLRQSEATFVPSSRCVTHSQWYRRQ
nr:PREDICTED: uncharacterized protein LOC102355849 [Latimeria chalumnae]|eukprot:XP_005999638.1 PREDICTED: uncharacterized protein LOC102355849 [Latimeria chalumnae]